MNRLSFRHIISGTTGRGFYIHDEDGRIVVHNQNCPDEVLAFWTHDTIMNAFVAKVRHLVVVTGERESSSVRFNSAHFCRELQISNLIDSIASGIVHIDFDAREELPPKTSLRNHGTKFRIKFENLKLIYHHVEEMQAEAGKINDFFTDALHQLPPPSKKKE